MNNYDRKNTRGGAPAGFTFKKSLGQNFMKDETVCRRMAADIDKDTCVIEIGPGAGVLTRQLSYAAKYVVAIEIDRRLEPVLQKELAECGNAKVIFADVMKTDLAALIRDEFGEGARVKICANLPYYITSPVIMDILSRRLAVEDLTVMVQKEAAIRLCAETGTAEAGAVTAAVRYYSKPKILFYVPRTSFVPAPKVDSAAIRLTLLDTPPVKVADEEHFFRVVKACFAYRRKTLINSVSNTLSLEKAAVKAALDKTGLDENVRGEALTLEQLAALADALYAQTGAHKPL